MNFISRKRGFLIDGPILLASLTLNILALLLPLGILLIFDRVIPFQSIETLTLITLVLLVAAGLEFALRSARSTILSRAAEVAAKQNQAVYLDRVVKANCQAFAEQPKAVVFERFNAIGRLRDHYSGQNQALSVDLPFTVAFVAMVGLIGGWMVVVPLGTALIVLMFSFFIKRRQAKLFGSRKGLDERRYAFLSEAFKEIDAVKANTMEHQLTRRFELLQNQTVTSSHQLIMFSGFAQNFSAILSQVAVAAMGIVGAYLVIQNTIGIAELAACMMLNGRIIQPLMKLMTFWVQSESISMSKGKLSDMDAFADGRSTSTQPSHFHGSVSLQDVVVETSGDRDHKKTAPLNMDLAAGEVALVTQDAPGSDLIRSLFLAVSGLKNPASGRILLDGYLAEDRTNQRGQDGLVWLESDPAVFHGTLLENISGFGGAEQSEYAVFVAAQLGLESRVNRLPHGYQTKMYDGGFFEKDPVNRQLIALVRAFAQRPKLLLMIEPTAVLEQAEREKLKAFMSSHCSEMSVILASPDPRMKGLATKQIALMSRDAPLIHEWDQDATSDRSSSKEKVAS